MNNKELNRLVAEKVMGWRYEKSYQQKYGWRLSHYRDSKDTFAFNSWEFNPYSDRNHLAMCLKKLSQLQKADLSFKVSTEVGTHLTIMTAVDALLLPPATLATIIADIVEGD